MSRILIAAISLLTLSTLALAVTLGVVLASDDDGGDTNHRMDAGYAGMMGAMANMDSDAMLERMREVLGEERYTAMLAHMRDHRDGAAEPPGSGLDAMMHQMMDGMMSTMPADAGGHMFPNDDAPMATQPVTKN